MPHQPIEKLLPRAGWSIFRLVRMAARRALELSEGQPPLIKNLTTDKETSIALEEIALGRIVYVNGSAGKGSTKKVVVEPIEQPILAEKGEEN